MRKLETKDIILIALYAALAIVVDYFKELLTFLDLPMGGSINIALIPVVVGAFHLGPKKGVLIGFLWWLVSSLFGLNPYFINVVQYLLDYIVPSVIIGASSIFYKKRSLLEAEAGILLTMAIRTLSIVISGVYFWPDGVAAGSWAAWMASLSYNLPYCIATGVMLMAVVPIVISRIKHITKAWSS